MIIKIFALSIVTICLVVVLIWSVVALVRLLTRELDLDHQETRSATREMNEAREDLEDAIRRAERRESTQQGDLK